MTRHLDQTRKQIEMYMAAYGVVFGAGLMVLLAAGGQPLYWLQVSQNTQTDVALLILFAGVVHALGIQINGRWRWSPALRLAGMAAHASAMTWLTGAAFIATVGSYYGVASGVVTYGPFAWAFWCLAFGSWVDLKRSLALWRI